MDAIGSGLAMLQAVSAILESSMIDAPFDARPLHTPSAQVWADAHTGKQAFPVDLTPSKLSVVP